MLKVEAMNDIGIFPVRKHGLNIAKLIKAQLNSTIYEPWLDSVSLKSQFAKLYFTHKQWVFIGANAIALRFLNGIISHKKIDPAVVVVDEAARYSISLLSGHEGGANNLAYTVANIINALPVITTASETLKPLVIGIGCRKGVSVNTIEQACLKAYPGLNFNEVRLVTTIDIKRNELGLQDFCVKHNLNLLIFSQLAIANRQWYKTKSQFVKKITGSYSVCEPCALMAGNQSQLIVKKSIYNGVAIAIAQDLNLPDSNFFKEEL